MNINLTNKRTPKLVSIAQVLDNFCAQIVVPVFRLGMSLTGVRVIVDNRNHIIKKMETDSCQEPPES
jgi:hypothetical protein